MVNHSTNCSDRTTRYTVEDLLIRQHILETGLYVFPLIRGGKTPAVESWRHGKLDPNVTAEQIAPAYGIELTDDYLVIDVDPRNFSPGDDPLTRLFSEAKITQNDLQDIQPLVVKTPSGGHHMYFRKPPNVFVRKNIRDEIGNALRYPGLDFLSEGCYVVGPGSLIEGFGSYKILKGSVDAIPTAPKELIKLLARLSGEKGPRKRGPGEVLEYNDSDELCQRFIDYVVKCPPALQGQLGDSSTFKTACVGRDLGLSPEKCYFIMLEHYNPRCIPEWSEAELETKVRNAYEYAAGELGALNHTNSFNVVQSELLDSDKAASLTTYRWDFLPQKPGVPPMLRPNSKHNIANFLSIKDFDGTPNPMYRIIGYNSFSNRFEYLYTPPYHKGVVIESEISDNDYLLIADWIYQNFSGYRAETKVIREGIQMFALKTNRFHPIQTYLSGLKWDKKPRLDTMLSTYMGVDDTHYTRSVSRCFMIGAVARVFNPGCQFDHMLVLEGPQGIGKSSFCRILGRKEWHSEILLDPHNKDTIAKIQGVWIVEASEMEFTRKADVMAVKAFLTATKDRTRKAYAMDAKDYHRQCIFIGTINPEAEGGYFKDTTGNRRFWPVACRGLRMQEFMNDIDQLWAEAAHRYTLREDYYLTDDKAISAALAEQQARATSDPWLLLITQWIEAREAAGRPVYETTPVEIATTVLNFPAKELKTTIINRIANILAFRLLWVKVGQKGVYANKSPKRFVYCNPKYYDPDFYGV